MLILVSKVCQHLLELVCDRLDAVAIDLILTVFIIPRKENLTEDILNFTGLYVGTFLKYFSTLRISLAELFNFKARLVDIKTKDTVYESFNQCFKLLCLHLFILVSVNSSKDSINSLICEMLVINLPISTDIFNSVLFEKVCDELAEFATIKPVFAFLFYLVVKLGFVFD